MQSQSQQSFVRETSLSARKKAAKDADSKNDGISPTPPTVSTAISSTVISAQPISPAVVSTGSSSFDFDSIDISSAFSMRNIVKDLSLEQQPDSKKKNWASKKNSGRNEVGEKEASTDNSQTNKDNESDSKPKVKRGRKPKPIESPVSGSLENNSKDINNHAFNIDFRTDFNGTPTRQDNEDEDFRDPSLEELEAVEADLEKSVKISNDRDYEFNLTEGGGSLSREFFKDLDSNAISSAAETDSVVGLTTPVPKKTSARGAGAEDAPSDEEIATINNILYSLDGLSLDGILMKATGNASSDPQPTAAAPQISSYEKVADGNTASSKGVVKGIVLSDSDVDINSVDTGLSLGLDSRELENLRKFDFDLDSVSSDLYSDLYPGDEIFVASTKAGALPRMLGAAGVDLDLDEGDVRAIPVDNKLLVQLPGNSGASTDSARGTFSSKQQAMAQASAAAAVRAASARRKKELIASGMSKTDAATSLKKEIARQPGGQLRPDDRFLIDGVEIDTAAAKQGVVPPPIEEFRRLLESLGGDALFTDTALPPKPATSPPPPLAQVATETKKKRPKDSDDDDDEEEDDDDDDDDGDVDSDVDTVEDMGLVESGYPLYKGDDPETCLPGLRSDALTKLQMGLDLKLKMTESELKTAILTRLNLTEQELEQLMIDTYSRRTQESISTFKELQDMDMTHAVMLTLDLPLTYTELSDLVLKEENAIHEGNQCRMNVVAAYSGKEAYDIAVKVMDYLYEGMDRHPLVNFQLLDYLGSGRGEAGDVKPGGLELPAEDALDSSVEATSSHVEVITEERVTRKIALVEADAVKIKTKTASDRGISLENPEQVLAIEAEEDAVAFRDGEDAIEGRGSDDDSDYMKSDDQNQDGQLRRDMSNDADEFVSLQIWCESYNTYHLLDGTAMKAAWGSLRPDIVLAPHNLQAMLEKVQLALEEDLSEAVVLTPRMRSVRLRGGANEMVMGYNTEFSEAEFSVVKVR